MEELKLILQTVGELGGSAMWLFIVYMVKDLLIYFAGFGCLFFFVFMITKIVQKLIEGLSLIEKIKVRMRFVGDLTPREKETIMETLDKGLNKEK